MGDGDGSLKRKFNAFMHVFPALSKVQLYRLLNCLRREWFELGMIVVIEDHVGSV